MKVTRIDHVSLNVHDHTEETQAFYEDLLGLSTTPRPKAFESFPGAWLEAGNAQIHLIGVAEDGRPRNPVGAHFAVRVDDLDAAVEEFERRGIEYRSFGDGGSRQVWISDPAGNTVEFQQERD